MSLKTDRKTSPIPRTYINLYLRILKKIYGMSIPHGKFHTNSRYSFKKGKNKKRVIHDGDIID